MTTTDPDDTLAALLWRSRIDAIDRLYETGPDPQRWDMLDPSERSTWREVAADVLAAGYTPPSAPPAATKPDEIGDAYFLGFGAGVREAESRVGKPDGLREAVEALAAEWEAGRAPTAAAELRALLADAPTQAGEA